MKFIIFIYFVITKPKNLINIDLQYLFSYNVEMSITKKTTFYSPNLDSLFHIQVQNPADIIDK